MLRVRRALQLAEVASSILRRTGVQETTRRRVGTVRHSSSQHGGDLLVLTAGKRHGDVVHVVEPLAVKAAYDVHYVTEDDSAVKGPWLRSIARSLDL